MAIAADVRLAKTISSSSRFAMKSKARTETRPSSSYVVTRATTGLETSDRPFNWLRRPVRSQPCSSNPKFRAITAFVRLDIETYQQQIADALIVVGPGMMHEIIE
jgi:hypothetical protein